MNREATVRESLLGYVYRKFQDYLLAAGLVALLVLLDADELRSSRSITSGTLLFVNVGLVGVSVALAIRGATKRHRRRYTVAGERIVLPVGGKGIPIWLPISDIVGISMTPLPPPRAHVPGSVRVSVVMDDTRERNSTGIAVIEIAAGIDAFGLRNLQDIVMRLPEAKLDHTFARPWRARLLSSGI